MHAFMSSVQLDIYFIITLHLYTIVDIKVHKRNSLFQNHTQSLNKHGYSPGFYLQKK